MSQMNLIPFSKRMTTIMLMITLISTPIMGLSDINEMILGTDVSSSRAIITESVDIGMDIPKQDPAYMILCPALFKEECIPLARHRTEMGLPTVIFGLEDIQANNTGRDHQEKVHGFLKKYKIEHPTLKWLLIMGDSEFLKPRELWHYAKERSQPYENTYHSDVYYAGLGSNWDDDGDGRYGEVYFNGYAEGDRDWDLFVGRVPASTEQHAVNYVSKLIAYEKNPPVGTWMKRFTNWGSVMEPPNRVDVPNDPYNYHSYKSNAYKVCQQINEKLPDHIVVQELYDYPQLEPGNYTPGDGRDTLNRQNMLAQFNKGSSMLNFAGQARYQAYALNEYGPPYGDGYTYTWNEPMTYKDPGNFTNGGMLPLMYASTCDTAKFFQTGYWEDKSLETWVTTAGGGVIGLISSTNVSARGEQKNLSWGNWYLDRMFWERFFDSGETRPGKALYTLKELYEKEWYSPTLQIKESIMGMIYAYILLGDPYVDIYSDVAERFPSDMGSGIDIYQGNHSVRFKVNDRNGDPVPGAKVNLYSHSTYSTFMADENGWIERAFDPFGDDIINMTISAHNMVTRSFQIIVKEEIADMVIEEDSLQVGPEPQEHGDNVSIEFSIFNRGGMTAFSTGVNVLSSFDKENWTAIDSIETGDITPGERATFRYDHRASAGIEYLRFKVITTSSEIYEDNNEVLVEFDIPEPRFIFEGNTGTIRPDNVVRPGSDVRVDYVVFNEGAAAGNVDLRIFLGNPEEDGIPLSEILSHGRIEANTWGNGSIDFNCPDDTSLIYLVMDPLKEYRPHISDEPVKALVEINVEPRVTGNLSILMLEDSKNRSIRIDDVFDDEDNVTADLSFSIGTIENITCSLREDDAGVFAVIIPEDNWFGNASVPIYASDGLGYVETDLEITVLPVNDPPFFKNLQGGQIRLTMVEDSPFIFRIEAGDIEGDKITFHSPDAPFHLHPETGELKWTPGHEDVGVSSWTIEIVDDQGGSATALIVIEVLPTNDPPKISGLKDILVGYRDRARMEFSVKDEENDDITITASHGFITILRNELIVVEWESGHTEPVNVTLEISDGINTVYANFMVEFQGPPDGQEGVVSGSVDAETIMIGVGIAIAVFALLLILFLFMRRKDTSYVVEEEKQQADEYYMDNIRPVEE